MTRPISSTSKILGRQPNSTSTLSRPSAAPKTTSATLPKSSSSTSSLRPVAAKTTKPTTTSVVGTRNVRAATTRPTATSTLAAKGSTTARKPEMTKPTTSAAPRAVKKPVKPEAATATNGLSTTGVPSTNGN